MAAPSGPEEENPLRLGRAYNISIYVMVSMPYLLLGSVGFLIYRGVKKNQALRGAAGGPLAGPEGLSWSPPSRDDNSWPKV